MLRELGEGQGESFLPLPPWCEGPATCGRTMPHIPTGLTTDWPGCGSPWMGGKEKGRKGRRQGCTAVSPIRTPASRGTVLTPRKEEENKRPPSAKGDFQQQQSPSFLPIFRGCVFPLGCVGVQARCGCSISGERCCSGRTIVIPQGTRVASYGCQSCTVNTVE